MKPRVGLVFISRRIMPTAFALAGIALILINTSRYGIGLAPDSANYVSAARSLLAGQGLLCFDGTPFASWPPLYPVLLAPLGLGGSDVIAGARILHALVFGAIVFLSARLFRTALRSSFLVIIGTLFVLFSNTLQSLSAMLLSEAVFCLLALLFLAVVSRLPLKPGVMFMSACVLLAALLPLQRYVGVVFVLGAGVAILVAARQWNWRGRLWRAAAVCAAAAIPLLPWLARNRLLTGTLTGEQSPAGQAFLQKTAMVLHVIRHWFLPSIGSGWIAWVLLGAFTAGFVFLLGYAWRSTRAESSEGAMLVRFSLVSLVIYLVALVVAASLVAFDEISARLLAPLYVPAVLLLLVGLERTGTLVASRFSRKRVIDAVVVTLCAVAVLHQLNWTLRFSRTWRADGMGGYTHEKWQESALVRWLRHSRLDGQVLSNDPAAVYLLAGMEARMSLRRTDDVAAICRSRELKPGDHLVWFFSVERPYLFQVGELHEMLPMEIVHSATDGAVLMFR